MADGDPEFLVHLAMRSLAVAAEANAASHETRTGPSKRAEIRSCIASGKRPRESRCAKVAELDLATEIYQAVNEANRAAPSARRSSLAAIEHAALAFARFFLGWLEGRAPNADPSEAEVVGLVSGLRNLLVEKGVVDSAYRLDAAGEAAAAALNFVEHHCRATARIAVWTAATRMVDCCSIREPPLWEVRPEGSAGPSQPRS